MDRREGMVTLKGMGGKMGDGKGRWMIDCIFCSRIRDGPFSILVGDKRA